MQVVFHRLCPAILEEVFANLSVMNGEETRDRANGPCKLINGGETILPCVPYTGLLLCNLNYYKGIIF